MKFLAFLLVALAIFLALPILAPLVGIGVALMCVGGGFFIWLLPILIIAASDRTDGAEKLAWILAIVFLSWFAWIFYFLLAPIRGDSRRREYRYYRSDY